MIADFKKKLRASRRLQASTSVRNNAFVAGCAAVTGTTMPIENHI
jgi:hypothetical protein